VGGIIQESRAALSRYTRAASSESASELALSDPMHEFDAGDRRRGSSKVLEAEHRTEPQLDRSVILLNQIVDVLGRPDLALISLRMFAESLLGRAMRSLIAVERDLMRQSALASESAPEERLGGGDVSFGAQLCRKIGDDVNQAADLISATASIPSLNFIPLTTFGNWF